MPLRPLRRFVFVRVLQDVLFLGEAAWFAVLYVVPPVRHYNITWIQNFDYGILYNSSQMLAHFRAPFVTTRGTHSWADNQDYFQILLAPLHWLPAPHYWLLVSHSLAIFACGVFCYFFLRRFGLVALLVPLVVWTSPHLANMNIDLFHTEAFATILLLIMFYGALRGRVALFWIGTLLALACKEDVAITVGAFMFLAFFRPDLFRVGRRQLVAGFAAALGVFVLNQWVVLPHYKVATCQWLDADMASENMRSGPISPWFSDVWTQWLNPSWYRIKLGHPLVLHYLALLLWPLPFFVWHTFPIVLLPLAGAVINVIGSGYLIQTAYHYDHSTYASIIIVMLLGLERMRWRTAVGLVLAGVALWIDLRTTAVRMKLTAPKAAPDFWELAKDERTVFLERLSDVLPRDIVIAADYTSINYLLPGRDAVYMLENPFRPDNFGIYGLCDGAVGKYRSVPTVDLAVVRSGFSMTPDVRQKIASGFDAYTVRLFGGRYPMALLINKQSPRYDELLAAAREMGAQPTGFAESFGG